MVIRFKLVEDMSNSAGFTVLVDDSFDISRKEQVLIGVVFAEIQHSKIFIR